MTTEENEVLETLADAWNQFVQLPAEHPWDRQEFMHAIHAAQNIVLSREAMRNMDCHEKWFGRTLSKPPEVERRDKQFDTR